APEEPGVYMIWRFNELQQSMEEAKAIFEQGQSADARKAKTLLQLRREGVEPAFEKVAFACATRAVATAAASLLHRLPNRGESSVQVAILTNATSPWCNPIISPRTIQSWGQRHRDIASMLSRGLGESERNDGSLTVPGSAFAKGARQLPKEHGQGCYPGASKGDAFRGFGQVAARFKEHNGLRIAAIHSTGALCDWNKAHPEKQVKAGDLLVEIDSQKPEGGMRGNGKELYEELLRVPRPCRLVIGAGPLHVG
ncbi:unnamed protein product, partial [Symbiodinium sp. KB8]